MHEVNQLHSSTGGGEIRPTEQMAYTIPQAARTLGLSDRKVWDLVLTDTIASIKIGRSRRIARQDLEAYVESLRSAA